MDFDDLLMSYNSASSHYRHLHAPNRLYLLSDTTVRKGHLSKIYLM